MKRYGHFPERRNAEGQPLCKWCTNVVPKGRRCFCSNSCAYEVQIRRDSGFLRREVKKRDKGVCANCGIDTERLKRILRFAREALADLLLEKSERCFANLFWFSGVMRALWGEVLWAHVQAMCSWQADHIVEVVDGGAPYLDNIQTLCVPCHKAKTKAMHGARARARREQRQQVLIA